MAHKFASWIVTEKGRQFTFRAVCATSIGIVCGYTLPHTFLLDKYKETVQLYKSGVSVKVSESVNTRFNAVFDILEFPEEHRQRIKPFTVFGFDIFYAGNIYSRFGGYVGIPINFTYSSVEDIDKNEFLIEGEPVNWSKPEAEQLLKSLVLSEQAQLFAIAREISFINSYKLMLDTLYGIGTFILMYGAASNTNRKFNLYARPFPMRGLLYSILTWFGFGVYSLLTDYTQNYYEQSIDEELCKKNGIFAEGGKEFYEKILQRNIALRKLLGSYGERKYSSLGNENYLLRQKHLPLITRKEYFEKYYQTM